MESEKLKVEFYKFEVWRVKSGVVPNLMQFHFSLFTFQTPHFTLQIPHFKLPTPLPTFQTAICTIYCGKYRQFCSDKALNINLYSLDNTFFKVYNI